MAAGRNGCANMATVTLAVVAVIALVEILHTL